MFITSKIIVLIISVHVAFAWLPPERCKQSKRSERSLNDSLTSNLKNAPVVENITQIADDQNKKLKETYRDSEFFGVPIRGYYSDMTECDSTGCHGPTYNMYIPNNCTFHTRSPRLISSVYCQDGVSCKIARSVSTVDSYTASEGYNWGVKISAKWSTPVVKTFEVGGEVSTGGTYSCTYTKGKTTTDNVECSVSSVGSKTLQLYTVQSDMECQFSTVTMIQVARNGKYEAWAPYNYFTNDERKMVHDHPLIDSYNQLVVIYNVLRRISFFFLNYI